MSRCGYWTLVAIWCSASGFALAEDSAKSSTKAPAPAAKGAAAKLPKLDSAEEYINRGDEERRQHKFTQAKADFDAALQTRCRKYSCTGGTGLALASLNRPDDAIADCEAALKLNPQSSGAFCKRKCPIRQERLQAGHCRLYGSHSSGAERSQRVEHRGVSLITQNKPQQGDRRLLGGHSLRP